MQAAVREWITNITMIAILGALVDIILPGSSFRKYTKFLFGLVILILFLRPITRLLDPAYDFESEIFRNALVQNTEATAFQSSRMEEEQKQRLENNFRENLEKELAFQLERTAGLENASVAITFRKAEGETDLSTMERIDISVAWKDQATFVEPVAIGSGKDPANQPVGDAEKSSEVKEFVSELYGMEKDRIFVNGK